MNNSLPGVIHVIFGNIEFLTILVQHFNLNARDRIIYFTGTVFLCNQTRSLTTIDKYPYRYG